MRWLTPSSRSPAASAKNSRLSYFWRADQKQHRDTEGDDSRIEQRPQERARRKSRHRGKGLARTTIQPCVEQLKNRDTDRRNEEPSEVIADRDAKVRPRRIVPENFAEEPSVAEHAQRVDHHIDHHHEQRRHQPYARRAPKLPRIEQTQVPSAPVQRRGEQKRHGIAREGEKRERERVHQGHAEDPDFASAGRLEVMIEAEGEAVVHGTPFARQCNNIRQDSEQQRRAETEVDDRDKEERGEKDKDVWAKRDG